ncbi:GTP pyrophosphokinase [Rouxiella badensis]|uniref:GTP pyrophosphokinase n=1 Tax=Rouxiella badensis TaxID=1646377 RepID=UPI00178883B0|nr:RelA/SpoT domain-containing protein [Rouxiella badensis]QOI56574.1 RelA/SpoT domain-containing protein [Rouxiella badensis subsp. acadiensis]
MERHEFIELYKSERAMYKAWSNFVISKIDAELRSRLERQSVYDEYVKIKPSGRVKTVDSLVAKAFLRKKGKYKDPYREITDKAGIRFVVLLTDQLNLLTDIVESRPFWTFSKDKEFDEWRSSDARIFDYQSVHYIVYANGEQEHEGQLIKEGTPCEVQLRTLLQHAYAELAHDTVYKTDLEVAPSIRRNFAKSMALMETTDDLLCHAKKELEAASVDVIKWLNALNAQASNSGIVSSDDIDDRNAVIFVDSHRKLLSRSTVEELKAFLENPDYSFINEKIKQHQATSDFFEFRQPIIFLSYFLAFRFSTTLKNYWPTDFSILQRIYNDLGISPNWADV